MLPLFFLGSSSNAYSATEYFQPELITSRFADPVIRAGNGPAAILVTDLDEDGAADLVVVAKDSDAIGIQPGEGGGRYDFLRYKGFPAGNSPVALALGDFNDDGRKDIAVVAQDDNAVDVFLCKEDGGFEPRNEYIVGARPSAITIADLNADGVADLVTANSASNTVSVMAGKSDGTFGKAKQFPTGINPVDIAAFDSVSEGSTVIATVNSGDNSISILTINDDGSLGSAVSYGVGRSPSSVAVADINGDKRIDIAVANQDDGTVGVLFGESDGSFSAQTVLDGAAEPLRVALTDLDGDSRLDIITAGATGDVAVFKGGKGGSFEPAVRYAAGTHLSDLAVADANGDGRKDVVVTNYGGISGNGDGIIFLFANGDGTLQARTDYDLADIVFAEGVAEGDLNGDGKPDLAVVYGPDSGGSILQVWVGTSTGGLELKQNIAIPSGAGQVYVADITGDGKDDLVTVGGYRYIDLFVADGAGGFAAAGQIETGIIPAAAAIADFNGDGALDIVTANSDEGTVSVHLGVGDGTFDAEPYRTFAAGEGVYDVKAADFNEDGDLDLVTANYNAISASVLIGNGDGTFQAKTDYSSADSESTPQSVATADFNADGDQDFAVAFSGTNSIAIYLGKGDGSFQEPVYYTMWWAGPVGLIARDIDGDGDADLLMANDASDNISVLYGAGDGTFVGEAEIAANNSPRSLVVANFNDDDRIDMAVATGAGFSVIPGVNRPPATIGGSFTMNEGGSISGKLSAEDPDPDDTALSFGLLKQPRHGQVVLASDGTFTYTPVADFHGDDQFTYNVSDEHVSSDDAAAQIHVTEASGSSDDLPNPTDPSHLSSGNSSTGGGGGSGPPILLFLGCLVIGIGWRCRYK